MKISLKIFLEPITVANRPLEGRWKAYKMDNDCPGGNDMRAFVGLGSCNCCDYFLPRKDDVVLIEETRLSESLRCAKRRYDKYKCIEDKDKNKFAIKKDQESMRLKVYGALLVICRLAAICCKARRAIRGKKYTFWLVDSSIEKVDIRAVKGLRKQFSRTLEKNLQDPVGKKILKSVEILLPAALEKELSKQ